MNLKVKYRWVGQVKIEHPKNVFSFAIRYRTLDFAAHAKNMQMTGLKGGSYKTEG